MDNKKNKLKKYTERHLRRLAKNDTDLFLNATEDISDNEEVPNTSENTSVLRHHMMSTSYELYNSSPQQSSFGTSQDLSIASSSSNISSDASSSSISGNNSSDSVSVIENPSKADSPSSAFKKDLVQWAVQFNIPHNALSSLLKVLKKHTNFELPSDSRTLLKTPRQIQIRQLDSGLYYHFGLYRVLFAICDDYVAYNVNTNIINLLLNVDGLPISRSSSSCLWPILCSEKELQKVYLVGAYYGTGKPKNANDFLKEAVEELINVIENGFLCNNNFFQVRLYALVCDTPAKSFVLSVKGHSGFSSCTKCTVHGEYEKDRVCFIDSSSATPRTRDSFISQNDEDFHNGISILIECPHFDPVLDVPNDYMHLVCLGVVKKIIKLLINGPLSVRICSSQVSRISALLEALKDTIPSEFSRKPRSLQWWKQWKATEWRQFLLYLGPLVLKNEVRPEIYLNFMTLHVAITILSSDSHSSNSENLQYAHNLILHFIESFGLIYGKEFISHNVHCLMHLVDDVRRFGPLDNFSAFRFENHMLSIKKMLRKSDKPLQQLAKRLEEKNDTEKITKERPDSLCFMHQHEDGPLPPDLDQVDVQYKIYKTKNFTLNSTDEKNNCCILKDGTVVDVHNIVTINNENFIIGKCHLVKEDFFSAPCNSRNLNIFLVQFGNLLKYWTINDIVYKMWKMPNTSNKSCIVIPVLHTSS